jgi:hypothetical protein
MGISLERVVGRWRSALWACLLSIAACTAIIDNDKAKLGAMPIPCEMGQSAICPCPDGTPSTQICNNSARYDPCMCRGTTANRAGQSGAATAGRAGAAGGAGRAGALGAAGAGAAAAGGRVGAAGR